MNRPTHNPNELPDVDVGQTGNSPSDDNEVERPHDPSRRGQNHIQGEDVGTTGGSRDRQPQQSMIPDAELNGT